MTVVIPVRNGDHNPELRFMLRCLETNWPDHGDIWIVGYQPNWLTNVNHIPGNTDRRPYVNVFNNILSAATHHDIPDEFVLFNDDFFITEPIDRIAVMHRGLLTDHIERLKPRRGWWPESLKTTLKVLKAAGIADPLSYEVHAPMRLHKHALADIMTEYADTAPDHPPQARSLYGNLRNLAGQQIKDPKLYRAGNVPKPFHSTSDSSFRWFRAYYHRTYPTPSRYEKA